jgi:hypothetical protein
VRPDVAVAVGSWWLAAHPISITSRGNLERRCGVMPFKSEAQRRYFEANKGKLEKQGVDVKEWEESSRGLKLPERTHKRKPAKKK